MQGTFSQIMESEKRKSNPLIVSPALGGKKSNGDSLLGFLAKQRQPELKRGKNPRDYLVHSCISDSNYSLKKARPIFKKPLKFCSLLETIIWDTEKCVSYQL